MTHPPSTVDCLASPSQKGLADAQQALPAQHSPIALPCRRARERRIRMCWSKHEREQWERERREAELEAERIRLVSRKPVAEEPAPEMDAEEREGELVPS